MKTTVKSKWLVDTSLFVLFLSAFFLELTGVSLHQWIGVAVGSIIAYHLATHWSWVESVTVRFFGKTSRRSRLYYALDAALFGGFAAITGTGLVISTWLNLPLAAYAAWRAVHVAASLLTLLLTVVKLGLHWRWIVTVAKSIFSRPVSLPQGAVTITTVPSTRHMGRREFTRVMAVVGISSAIALIQGIKNLSQEEHTAAAAISSDISASDTFQLSDLFDSQQSTTANQAAARCPRGCSYPGHCRRYTDSNGNRRCDLGESA